MLWIMLYTRHTDRVQLCADSVWIGKYYYIETMIADSGEYY